jgi:hypothetical protein
MREHPVSRAWRAAAPSRAVLAVLAAACVVSCDSPRGDAVPGTSVAPPSPPAPPPPAFVEPPRAPEIIVDAAKISIGTDQVPVGELGLADKIGVFLSGRPGVAGQVVDVVAMRNAKPSPVVATVRALRRAGASGATVRTESRGGATEGLPLAFVARVADCATVAWIARDAAIDVWPAGGGRARRVIKGMAGPDMTLGTEAVQTQQTQQKQGAGCGASELLVGSDDRLTWGLVFDLATTSLHAPGARASAAVLVDDAVPGRKVVLESP